jgi:hypothetical protein
VSAADRDRVRAVRLVRDGRVLDRIVVSANAPEVSFDVPPGGTWSGRRTLSWNANDADGDALTSHVVYSPDGGQRWFPVARWHRGNALEVDADQLPGGSRGRFRVIASDGFHTVSAETTADIVVSNKPPRVSARLEHHGGEITAGEPIELRGVAHDLEDGELLDEQLVWSLDGRVIGVGKRLRARLPEGTWDVRLGSFDDDGATAETLVSVTVLPAESEPPTPSFRRGDADGSGTHEITDAIATLSYLFLGGFEPTCDDALDTDDDGQIGLADAIRTLIYLFQRPIAIPEPFPGCGQDPTPDELDCERNPSCAL